MPMPAEALVIDADGHILEPPDLWEKYLEPKYRDRAIRITVGDDGYEYLEVDRRRAKMSRPGQLGTLGGMGKQIEEARRRREDLVNAGRAEEFRYIKPKPEETYLKGAAFGTMDMKERLQLLDQEGLARALLYPTLGLLWEAETMDAEISAAYCPPTTAGLPTSAVTRAAGSCRSPISRSAILTAAARELERAVKDGCKGAFVAPFNIARRSAWRCGP